MPRKIRIHTNSGFHHVMMRENYQRDLFLNEEDYLDFYNIIDETSKNYGFEIHLFCLMANHIHLAIELNNTHLYKIMQLICGRYSTRHN